MIDGTVRDMHMKIREKEGLEAGKKEERRIKKEVE